MQAIQGSALAEAPQGQVQHYSQYSPCQGSKFDARGVNKKPIRGCCPSPVLNLVVHSTGKTQQGSNFQRKHTRCASSKILHITAGSQHFRCKFTALSQHFHCRCTGLSLQVHSTFAAGSLDFHCRFTAGSQHFHCRFTAWYMVKSFLKSQAPPTHKKNPGMVHGKIFPEKPRP